MIDRDDYSRPTLAELRAEDAACPREVVVKRCACGAPLRRAGGWTYTTCGRCAA